MPEGTIAKLWERARQAPARIVLPEGEDARTAAAARILLDEGIASAVTVLGDREKVEAAFSEAGVAYDGVTGLDPRFAPERERYAAHLLERRAKKGMSEEAAAEAVTDVLYFGDGMVALGDADGCVAGACHTTGDVIRAALHMVGTAPGVRTVSGCFLMEVPDFLDTGAPKAFIFADCGVVPDPNPAQLADIAVASAGTYQALVGGDPQVAMLSFSTKGSAEHPRIDKVLEATRLAIEALGDEVVDGELQVDAALIPSVGKRKSPGSKVAGEANVLIFPDLDSGNIAYKITQRLAKAQAIGPLLQGLARPCHDLSRGASPTDIVTAAAVAVLQAGR